MSEPFRLDPALVFSRPGAPQFPERNAHGIFWVQALPEENGRLALMHRQPDGSMLTLTPSGYNIRSRVHEYGGRCHLLTDTHCLFINFEDQALYRQPLAGGPVEAMSGEPSRTDAAADLTRHRAEASDVIETPGRWMLADLCLHPGGRWLVAVGERTRHAGENENAIVILDLQQSDLPRHWQVLGSGHDFYAAPRFSPDGGGLCLLSWNHPDMPWDNASLELATFADESGELSELQPVAGGVDAAACQADFCQDGTLVFALDSGGEPSWKGFWNLHRLHHDAVEAVTREAAEYGAAHWVFGHVRVRPLDQHRILAVRTLRTGDELVMIESMSARVLDAGSEFVEFSQLSPVYDNQVLLMAASDCREPSVIAVNVDDGSVDIIHAGEAVMPLCSVSRAQAIKVPTRDGAITHAWYYAPSAGSRPEVAGGKPGAAQSLAARRLLADGSGQSPVASGQPPPAPGQPPRLMVLVHGGPTSRAGCSFDPLRQFWTTHGFAVLDVNHRGSTGYGRHYRQALDGYWGLRDVDDVIDAVQALVEARLADPRHVFIRGGSAGGYAVLAALTRYPDIFSAGACYYGIGNLVTLATSTHKFESRYLDSLLGQPWSPELAGDESSVYFSRSPINGIERVRSPMILFQGSEDKVVPPAVSHEVVAALRSAGIRHRYVEYEGEGHGFRSAPNRIDALQCEAAFYAEVSASSG